MAYIYQITNDINQKIYIGKTEFSIEKRFKEHCKDAFKDRNEKRPLYNAMRKYGIEHFHIELIEETNNPEEREVYWIEKKQSFKNGYNATIGGDGRKYIDYDLIYNLYQKGESQKSIVRLLGYDHKTVSRVLNSYGINSETKIQNGIIKSQKPVAKIDPKTGAILEVYASCSEAEKANGNSRHIASVCNGKRKTCQGYFWKFI